MTRDKLEELHAFESARLERVKERKTTMGLKAYLAGLRSVVADCQGRSMFASARGDYDAMHALMKYEHAAAALMDAEFDTFVELRLLANRAATSDKGLRVLHARECAAFEEGAAYMNGGVLPDGIREVAVHRYVSATPARAPDVTEGDVQAVLDDTDYQNARRMYDGGHGNTSPLIRRAQEIFSIRLADAVRRTPTGQRAGNRE